MSKHQETAKKIYNLPDHEIDWSHEEIRGRGLSNWKASHKRKVLYKTKERAFEAAEIMWSKGHWTIQVYKCDYGDHYHLGNSKRFKQQKRRRHFEEWNVEFNERVIHHLLEENNGKPRSRQKAIQKRFLAYLRKR